jgi:hypothetical protein
MSKTPLKNTKNIKKRTAKFSPDSDGPTSTKRNATDLSGTIFRTPHNTSTPKNVANPNVPAFEPTIVVGETNETNGAPPIIPVELRKSFEDSEVEHMQTSMKEIPKETNVYTSPSIGFIVLDVYSKNGADFDAILPKESIKFLWTNLGRRLEEVKIISEDRFTKRHLRLVFNLRRGHELSIAEITNSYETQIEIPSSTAVGASIDVFGIRFPQFKDLVCELGQVVSVTFKKVPPEVSCADLRNWLKMFGEAIGSFRY